MNQRPGKHRVFIDSATPNGAGEAILYTNNLFNANKAAYAGGADADLAIVVCMRHFATPFAFTDAMWAKYGKVIGGMVNFTDPKAKAAPAINLYWNSPEYGLSLPNLTNDSILAFRYSLGLVLEASGRPMEALEQFEAVFAMQPNYPEVAAKIRELRR